MAATSTQTSEVTLTLTAEEREQLLTYLDQALRDKQVEEHRTEAFAYREHIHHQIALLQSVIDKLRRT